MPLRDDGRRRPRRQGRHPPRQAGERDPRSRSTCSRTSPRRPSSAATETFDLEAWKVKPGTRIDYWLTVRDTKEPTSNRFETARQVIEVIAPLPPAEKAKFEETAKKEVEPETSPSPPSAATRPRTPTSPRRRRQSRPGRAASSPTRNRGNAEGAERPDLKDRGASERADERAPGPERRYAATARPPLAEDLRKLESLNKAMERMKQGQPPPDGNGIQHARKNLPAPATPASPVAKARPTTRPTTPSNPAARGDRTPQAQPNAPPEPIRTRGQPPNPGGNPSGDNEQVTRANRQAAPQPGSNPNSPPGTSPPTNDRRSPPPGAGTSSPDPSSNPAGPNNAASNPPGHKP